MTPIDSFIPLSLHQNSLHIVSVAAVCPAGMFMILAVLQSSDDDDDSAGDNKKKTLAQHLSTSLP
jgi:hypothetical protein